MFVHVGECVRWLNDHDQLWVHNITVLTIYIFIRGKYNIAGSSQVFHGSSTSWARIHTWANFRSPISLSFCFTHFTMLHWLLNVRIDQQLLLNIRVEIIINESIIFKYYWSLNFKWVNVVIIWLVQLCTS